MLNNLENFILSPEAPHQSVVICISFMTAMRMEMILSAVSQANPPVIYGPHAIG